MRSSRPSYGRAGNYVYQGSSSDGRLEPLSRGFTHHNSHLITSAYVHLYRCAFTNGSVISLKWPYNTGISLSHQAKHSRGGVVK